MKGKKKKIQIYQNLLLGEKSIDVVDGEVDHKRIQTARELRLERYTQTIRKRERERECRE